MTIGGASSGNGRPATVEYVLVFPSAYSCAGDERRAVGHDLQKPDDADLDDPEDHRQGCGKDQCRLRQSRPADGVRWFQLPFLKP